MKISTKTSYYHHTKSKADERHVDIGEEIFRIVYFILSSIQSFIIFITKNIHQQCLNIFLLSLGRINHIDHSFIRAESHVAFNNNSEHFAVDVHFVHLWEICHAGLGNCLGLVLKALFEGLTLLATSFGQTWFEFELFWHDFQFFSGLFTEFLEWSQFTFLSLWALFFMMVIVVVVLVSLFFVDIGCEKVNFPDIKYLVTKWWAHLFLGRQVFWQILEWHFQSRVHTGVQTLQSWLMVQSKWQLSQTLCRWNQKPWRLVRPKHQPNPWHNSFPCDKK